MYTSVQPLKQLVFQWPQHPEAAWLRKYALRGHKRGQALCNSVQSPQCLWKTIPGLCLPAPSLPSPWIVQSSCKWCYSKIDGSECLPWGLQQNAGRTSPNTKGRWMIIIVCKDFPVLQESCFLAVCRGKRCSNSCLQWGKCIIFSMYEWIVARVFHCLFLLIHLSGDSMTNKSHPQRKTSFPGKRGISTN